MSCNCGECAICKTTLNDFAATTTLADASYFVLANNKKVSLETLRQNLLPTVPVNDLSVIPDGTILRVEAGGIVASSMVEGDEIIESSKDLALPGDSLQFGDSVALHNVAQQLGIETGGNQFYILQSKVDDTQSYTPTWANLGAESVTNLQVTDSTNIVGTSISFQIPLTGTGLAWKINHMRLRGNAAVSGVRLVVSIGAAPLPDNSNVIYDWPQSDQWEDGEGYTFSSGDFSIDTHPLILDSDGAYYVTFEVPVGSGTQIDLKGNGSNVPYLRVDAQTGALENIITESALGTFVTGPASADDSNVAQYDGTTGKLLKDGGFSINDIKGANVVHVNSASELPPVVGGKHRPAANTVYVIDGNISTSNPILFGNNSAYVGFNRFSDFITYTGSGNMFEYSGSGSSYMAELGLTCSTGTVLSGTGTNSETIVFTNCYVIDCVKVGQLADMRNIVFRSFSVTAATDLTNGGLIVSGSTEEFNMDNSLWANVANGIMIDFQGTAFERIILPAGNRFEVDAGVTGIKAVASSGNFISTGRGILAHNIFAGSGTYTQNITNQDLQWEKTANAGIEDTTKNTQTYKHTVTTTTISLGSGDSGNPKLLNGGTSFVSAHSDQFTNSNSGRVTYIGKDTAEFHARVVQSGTAASGTNKTFNTYIAKNGTVIMASKAKQTYDSGSNLGVTTAAIVDLQENDYLEVFIENLTDTTDWSSDTVNFIVSQA